MKPPGSTGPVRISEALTSISDIPGARGFELQVRSTADTPQTITIEMRGKPIDTRTLHDDAWHTLSYSSPPSTNRPAAGEWITLRVDPSWKARGDRRTFGVMTRDLKWIE